MARLAVEPIKDSVVLNQRVYKQLKEAIVELDVYDPGVILRLDERKLAEDLGVSRTPIRECIIRLENEGFVRTLPHKGTFIVRKSLDEVINMVYVWAGLESMAARLLTERATDDEISQLRALFTTCDTKKEANINEYSERNIGFHRKIIEMSKCDPLIASAENLFDHLKIVRLRSIADSTRVKTSVIDHMDIIEALEQRHAELAEQRVRNHTLRLVEHLQEHAEEIFGAAA